MADFRFFVLCSCVVCLSVGCASGQIDRSVEVASVEPPETNPVVLNGVELCGPIYEALMYLGPKDEDGRLDMERIGWDSVWPGHPTVYLPVPSNLTTSETLRKATSVRLDEYEGRAVSVSLVFERGPEENTGIWNALLAAAKDVAGPPLEETDTKFYRERGLLHTGAIHSETMETVMFSMTCLPLKDDFLAGMDSASASDEGASEAVNPAEDEDENLANGFLGRTVLDVMLLSGQPAREPVWVGQDRVGFLYKKAGPYDMPTNEWIWFVRGTSAYLGWGFPPPFGPDHAIRTYFLNRQDFIDSMGEPDESIGGPRADRYQSLWRDGDIEMAFTLNDVHGYPRFLIEFFDRDLLEEIDFDLRPDRETVAQVAMIQPRPEPRAAER